MQNFNKKAHWEKIYQTQKLEELGWYQQVPSTSLELLNEVAINPNDKIIDVGAGDGYFVDHLLTLGYNNISILDISQTAITRAKDRLGSNADRINWIVADVTEFESEERYHFWHDRAVFHFLTEEVEIKKYIANALNQIIQGGYLVVGTFSEKGPKKCSGIPVHQYSTEELAIQFEPYFQLISARESEHITPSGNIQNYAYCSFYKK